jgi:hypothetical protein
MPEQPSNIQSESTFDCFDKKFEFFDSFSTQNFAKFDHRLSRANGTPYMSLPEEFLFLLQQKMIFKKSSSLKSILS